MSENEHRIKVKIGEAEFEAEGSAELVKEQFADFMATVASLPRPSPANPSNPEGENPRERDEGDPPPPGNDGGDQGEGITEALLNRIFHKKGDLISLSAMPKDRADALLMLIYGYAKLGNSPKVTGVTLMKAAKQSGLNLTRVDRLLGTRKDFVLAGGAKRGRRYHLNNPGERHVEKLIRGMQ